MSNVERRKKLVCVERAALQSHNVAHTSVKAIITASANRFDVSTQRVFEQMLNKIAVNATTNQHAGSLAVGDFNKMYAHHKIQAQLKQNFDVINRKSAKPLSRVEQLKVLSLSTLVSTPLFVQDRQLIAKEMDNLASAATEQQVKAVSRKLTSEIETQQNQLVIQSLQIACETASKDVGFKKIESHRQDGITRIIARDAKENVLVSEIIQDKKTKEINIVTEPIGLEDDSCNAIIDNYNKSLHKSGVVYSSRNRKFTGGVCELAFTKGYQKRLQKKRTRQLNRPKKHISIRR